MTASRNLPVHKTDDRYSTDKANLAYQPHQQLVEAFTDILRHCRRLLAPDATLAITARPYRRAGYLIDIPGDVINAAHTAGFMLDERLVCLLGRVDTGRLIPHASFFQVHAVRQARRAGTPLSVIAHEDLLIFRKASA